MKKNFKTTFVIVLMGCVVTSMVVFTIACNNKPSQPSAIQNMNASNTLKALRNKMNQRVIDTSIPKAILSINEKYFDFGDIKAGDVVTHNFTFTNTSTNPLVIYNVQGTCGCTVPNWPAHPVLPGDTGNITIQYNSKGEEGLQNKKVRVFTNTKPIETDVFFKADVKN